MFAASVVGQEPQLAWGLLRLGLDLGPQEEQRHAAGGEEPQLAWVFLGHHRLEQGPNGEGEEGEEHHRLAEDEAQAGWGLEHDDGEEQGPDADEQHYR